MKIIFVTKKPLTVFDIKKEINDEGIFEYIIKGIDNITIDRCD